MSDQHRMHPVSGEADAQGHAALLLVESLMHTLVDAGIMEPTAAVETARCAAEVRHEIVADNLDNASTATPPDLAAALLDRIAATFAIDASSGSAAL